MHMHVSKWMLEQESNGRQWTGLLIEVSGDHFCAACHFLSGWRVSQRPLLVYFYSFPFLLFFTSPLSPGGRGRWVRGFSTEWNRPSVWPRTPHLPTPQHTCSQWGLCNTGPKLTLAFPPKTGNRDWLSSCFSSNFLLCCPFPRLFSLFFSCSSWVGCT